MISFSRVTRDQEVEGYKVPGGSLAIVNLWQFMNDPEHWDRPHLFRSVTGRPLYCNTKRKCSTLQNNHLFILTQSTALHFNAQLLRLKRPDLCGKLDNESHLEKSVISLGQKEGRGGHTSVSKLQPSRDVATY